MNVFNALIKLIITYLKTFVAGLSILFLLILPMSTIIESDTTLGVLIVGVVLVFLIPGFQCALVLFPLALLDKNREGQSVKKLMEKYLPYTLIIPLITSIVVICIEDREVEKVAKYIIMSIYLLNITCLYMYCRTVKSPQA